MASSIGRRTATESAYIFSRVDASCHTFPRAKRRKVAIPSRRSTGARERVVSEREETRAIASHYRAARRCDPAGNWYLRRWRDVAAMTRLARMTVRGFKSIRELEDFKLERLNVLI